MCHTLDMNSLVSLYVDKYSWWVWSVSEHIVWSLLKSLWVRTLVQVISIFESFVYGFYEVIQTTYDL